MSSRLRNPLAAMPGAVLSTVQLPDFRGKPGPITASLPWKTDFTGRFRALLASKGQSINTLSEETRGLYGSSSAYFFPNDFAYRVSSGRTTPHVNQVFALSKCTGYDFADCLRFFGLFPEHIGRLQLELHRERTVLLSTANYDREKLVPLLGSPIEPGVFDRTGPLLGKIRQDIYLPINQIQGCAKHSFLYARIGIADALAFPELLPRSIVRVDQRRTAIQSRASNGNKHGKRPLYLVEYPGGLVCCHVDIADRDHILLSGSALPFALPQYRLYAEAAILGTVDAEIRPMPTSERSSVYPSLRLAQRRGTRSILSHDPTLSEVLSFHRERIGATIRQAHQMTIEIAAQLGNSDYTISTGSFVEFEATNAPPRHVEKLFSMCIVYNIDLWTLLRVLGLPLNEQGRDAIPTRLLPAGTSDKETLTAQPLAASDAPRFYSYLGQALEEIPLFLHEGLHNLAKGLHITPGDLFWISRKEDIYHPWMEGALLVAVTAHYGRVTDADWLEPWERPLYLLLLRDDRYAIGFCSQVEDRITLWPHPDCKAPARQFVDREDAEIIGRITAIARTLPQ